MDILTADSNGSAKSSKVMRTIPVEKGYAIDSYIYNYLTFGYNNTPKRVHILPLTPHNTYCSGDWSFWERLLIIEIDLIL